MYKQIIIHTTKPLTPPLIIPLRGGMQHGPHLDDLRPGPTLPAVHLYHSEELRALSVMVRSMATTLGSVSALSLIWFCLQMASVASGPP